MTNFPPLHMTAKNRATPKPLNWGTAVHNTEANRDRSAGLTMSYVPPAEVQGAKGVKLEKHDMDGEIGRWEHGVVGMSSDSIRQCSK